MKKEKKRAGLTQDVSNPGETQAIHSAALGKAEDYRALAAVKALVDGYFRDVQLGKKNPMVAMMCICDELAPILKNYITEQTKL